MHHIDCTVKIRVEILNYSMSTQHGLFNLNKDSAKTSQKQIMACLHTPSTSFTWKNHKQSQVNLNTHPFLNLIQHGWICSACPHGIKIMSSTEFTKFHNLIIFGWKKKSSSLKLKRHFSSIILFLIFHANAYFYYCIIKYKNIQKVLHGHPTMLVFSKSKFEHQTHLQHLPQSKISPLQSLQ